MSIAFGRKIADILPKQKWTWTQEYGLVNNDAHCSVMCIVGREREDLKVWQVCRLLVGIYMCIKTIHNYVTWPWRSYSSTFCCWRQFPLIFWLIIFWLWCHCNRNWTISISVTKDGYKKCKYIVNSCTCSYFSVIKYCTLWLLHARLDCIWNGQSSAK